MRENGEIVKIEGDVAFVRMVLGEKCEGCNLCSAFGENSKVLEARNVLGAKVGDRVTVEINPKLVVGHSLLVFVLPVISLIIGYFLGTLLSWPNNWSVEAQGILGAGCCLMLSLFPVRWYNARLSRSEGCSADIIATSEAE